jgi:hypothetical protein
MSISIITKGRISEGGPGSIVFITEINSEIKNTFNTGVLMEITENECRLNIESISISSVEVDENNTSNLNITGLIKSEIEVL